ncbi:hypothetical protein AB0E75_24995 [Streptomyces griseoviridis]|jgi:lysylphosphatidylglycerol synthetase-like protein (DUF2156 family)|uniref:DUF7144 domain-containing protein n=3 Tax=Streptomyces TaxID=1883 RepID=A0A918LKP5_STRGD|nr:MULTISPECIES: hypothetical protein [Streptomyces]MDP9684649.1 lysylphosphatidylglycerol synthetase-like protein (DUF2156 family) [Streptomyces griseoviridis]GGS63730.1 hypothetical protein GCM10010238_60970 [Streptomyces niveoruber]GGT21133.1 hypothetical protein GCM10010240_62520 [Streptomyces griseoviridis]GGU62062.1 hypothetical protein GCM10010259_60920 [Streptomyces daghestanicus]GHI30397.1 hypothetical protein Sdagh_21270 [Streptomyces daghestanicus]
MTQHAAPSPARTSGRHRGWVTGGVVFAGVLMLVNGALAVLQGIAAIAEDDVYARIGTYVYEMNLTGWGVVHVVLGALLLVTGYGLLKDMAWARFAGIALASLSLVAQFLFLPYAPVWSVIQIAIDVFVIWALASRQDEADRTV